MICDIHQGCAQSLLLMIMAVEPLYEMLGSTVREIRITNQSETLEIKVCGFADDTAVYVQYPKKVSVVMRTLNFLGLLLHWL